MVHSPAGRDWDCAALWQGDAHSRAWTSFQAPVWYRNCSHRAYCPGTQRRIRLQDRSTAYRRVQEIQGNADAEATKIYGQAYNKHPEFYAFLRTLESYKEKPNKNSVLILTTESDFYQYVKQANQGKAQTPLALD